MASLTVKNISKRKLTALKLRAKSNHRSLKGEMMSLIDKALQESMEKWRFEEAVAKVKAFDEAEAAQINRDSENVR